MASTIVVAIAPKIPNSEIKFMIKDSLFLKGFRKHIINKLMEQDRQHAVVYINGSFRKKTKKYTKNIFFATKKML